MTSPTQKRHFSRSTVHSNHGHLKKENEKNQQPRRIGFVLLEHFSMMSFTGAVDVLVTANLVETDKRFEYVTLSLSEPIVVSDLGIDIATSASLQDWQPNNDMDLDAVIVCGGYRVQLEANQRLTHYLQYCQRLGLYLGGLWNGIIPLAHAGLTDQTRVAVHPNNQPYVKEQFLSTKVASETSVFDNNILSCAGPASALAMMLTLVEQFHGHSIARAVGEILTCDQWSEQTVTPLTESQDEQKYPSVLQKVLTLIRNNIEEPLTLEELLTHAGVSRRQLERLFQQYLETSPSRYYLELRITYARRLLQQTNKSIIEVAVASGFVSASHFSNCFKDYFGASPSSFRKKKPL